jgi:hypothetical protein
MISNCDNEPSKTKLLEIVFMSATTDKIQKDSIVAFCKKTECTFVSIWEEQFIPVDEVSFSSHPSLEVKLP